MEVGHQNFLVGVLVEVDFLVFVLEEVVDEFAVSLLDALVAEYVYLVVLLEDVFSVLAELAGDVVDQTLLVDLLLQLDALLVGLSGHLFDFSRVDLLYRLVLPLLLEFDVVVDLGP